LEQYPSNFVDVCNVGQQEEPKREENRDQRARRGGEVARGVGSGQDRKTLRRSDQRHQTEKAFLFVSTGALILFSFSYLRT